MTAERFTIGFMIKELYQVSHFVFVLTTSSQMSITDIFAALQFFFSGFNTYIFPLITKTRLYNFDPLKPHFFILKLGVYRGIHYLSYYCSKHRLWYS